MSSGRVQYGYCSFIPPEGFVIQTEASFGDPDSPNDAKLLDGRKSPLCITLSSTAVHPEVPGFSESAADMNPDVYPVSLTLNTFVAHFAVSALDYLRRASEEFKKHFAGFQIDFCEADTVGEFPAARAQISYVSNFRIYQLHLAWLVNAMLVTATMTVTESGMAKGWKDLREFVESVTIGKTG